LDNGFENGYYLYKVLPLISIRGSQETRRNYPQTIESRDSSELTVIAKPVLGKKYGDCVR